MLSLRDEYLDLTFHLKVLQFTDKIKTDLDVEIEILLQKKVLTHISGSYLCSDDIWRIKEWLNELFMQGPYCEPNLYLSKPGISFHFLKSDQEGIQFSIGLHNEIGVEQEIFDSLYSEEALMELDRQYFCKPFESGCQIILNLKWQDFPSQLAQIKQAGGEFYRIDPHASELIDFEKFLMEARVPRTVRETGSSMLVINEQNNLSLKITSHGYSRGGSWVDIRVELNQGENNFTAVSECLFDHEIAHIEKWFKALLNRRLPSEATLEFLEPNIRFHFLERTRNWVLIMIELNMEFDSNFMAHQFHPDLFKRGTFGELLGELGQYPFWYRDKLIFPLGKNDLERIVKELEVISAELDEQLLEQIQLENAVRE